MRKREKRQLIRPTPAREARHHLQEGVITGAFDRDCQAMAELLADCADLKTSLIHTSDGRRIAVYYFSSLVNLQLLSDNILKPLRQNEGRLTTERLRQCIINIPDTKTECTLDNIGGAMADGSVAVIADGVPVAILANILQYEHRGIERSQSEDVIIGPHQSFSESLGQNVALLRRILATPRFKVRTIMLGRISRTKIAIMYLEGVAQQKLVREAEERLSRIDIDYVPGASYLLEFLEDEPISLFPQVRVTERPTRVAGALSEGRIAIIGEGDPSTYIIPSFLPEYLQSSEDYYEKPLVGTFLRLIRLVSTIVAIFLPGLWISLVVFHHGIIPPPLFNSIVSGREGVPLPSVLEAFLLLMAFDIVVEASTRLPSAVGQAIGIVGAIILGQSAVQASLVSPTMTIVVSLSGLATYTQSSPSLIGPTRILKYLVLMMVSIFGIFGLIWAVILLAIQTASIRSFGYPFLFPLAPFNPRGGMEIFVKLPNYLLKWRPHFLAAHNERRMSDNLIPKPGKDEPDETSN